jgi:hypothetical protein
MLKKDIGSLLKLVLTVGCLVLGSGTIALAETTQPSEGDHDKRIEGTCRFHGWFEGDKKDGGFAVNCRARLKFNKKDLWDRGDLASIQEERRRDNFELECDNDTIYDDGLRIKSDRDGGRRGRHGLDVVFSGIGRGSPKILIDDFRFDGEDSCETGDLDAVLLFQRWGFTYRIPGFCEFEEDSHHGLN